MFNSDVKALLLYLTDLIITGKSFLIELQSQSVEMDDSGDCGLFFLCSGNPCM